MSPSNFVHNFVSDPDEVAAFLQALIDGFRGRRLSVRFDGREAVMRPAEILDLSVEISKRKGRQKLTLVASWPDVEVRDRPGLLTPRELKED
jgi:amphi-Trp domain-containing protein